MRTASKSQGQGLFILYHGCTVLFISIVMLGGGTLRCAIEALPPRTLKYPRHHRSLSRASRPVRDLRSALLWSRTRCCARQSPADTDSSEAEQHSGISSSLAHDEPAGPSLRCSAQPQELLQGENAVSGSKQRSRRFARRLWASRSGLTLMAAGGLFSGAFAKQQDRSWSNAFFLHLHSSETLAYGWSHEEEPS